MSSTREINRKFASDNEIKRTVTSKPPFIAWGICILWFTSTFAQFGAAAYTGTLETYELAIGAEMVASTMLFMLCAAIAILAEI